MRLELNQKVSIDPRSGIIEYTEGIVERRRATGIGANTESADYLIFCNDEHRFWINKRHLTLIEGE